MSIDAFCCVIVVAEGAIRIQALRSVCFFLVTQAALGRLEDISPKTDTANPPLFPGKRKNL